MRYDHSKLRSWAGYRVFLTAGEFASAAADYFEWIDDHPLLEEVVGFYQGASCKEDRAKMRPYTRQGLARHLNIPVSRLETYKARGDDWAEVVEAIEAVMYQQKYEGAAAGLLSSTVVVRDLGLAEKSEMSGPGGGPIETATAINTGKLSDAAMEELLAAWDADESGDP